MLEGDSDTEGLSEGEGGGENDGEGVADEGGDEEGEDEESEDGGSEDTFFNPFNFDEGPPRGFKLREGSNTRVDNYFMFYTSILLAQPRWVIGEVTKTHVKGYTYHGLPATHDAYLNAAWRPTPVNLTKDLRKDGFWKALESISSKMYGVRDRTKTPKKRPRGAIHAPSRTNEEFTIASGLRESCLTDAVVNGLRAMHFKPSLAKMRNKSIPMLGNLLQATWESAQDALEKLNYPFKLVDVSSRFCNAKGGPMRALLRSRGVFIVGLHIIIHDEASEHAIMLDTVKRPHAPYGRMLDNSSSAKPVYLEENDKRTKKSAKAAFRKLVVPACSGWKFSVKTSDVYELIAL